MYSYLAFRTLTEAQRGLEILRSRHIPASLARRSAAAGCAHGIRVPAQFLERARAALLRAGVTFGGEPEP